MRIVLSLSILFATLASMTVAVRAQEAGEQLDAPGHTAGSIVPPRLIYFVQAPFPLGTRPTHSRAEVELRLSIDSSGQMIDAEAVSLWRDRFDRVAQETAMQFRFVPASQAGEPVPSQIRYRYAFELSSSDGVGSLREQVLSYAGEVIEDARVLLVSTEEGAVQHTRSAAAGWFRFDDLPGGTYQVRIDRPGFATRMQQTEAHPQRVRSGAQALSGRRPAA